MYFIPHSGQVNRARSSVRAPMCGPITDCKMADRFSSCWCSRCFFSAQAWHRCVSFLCPLMMSVRWTVAGFEQNWHFTPRPPRRRLRLSAWLALSRKRPGSAFLQRPNLVAQLGGFLVVFLVDRLLEAVAELHQLRLGLLVLRQPPRRLADVARLAVDVLQQRRQLLAELLVVVRAAQPAGVAELHELDAAVRTLALVQRRGLLALADGLAAQALEGPLLLRLVEVLIGTLFAQMQLFELAFAEHFGDVQGGRVVALLTFHCRDPRCCLIPAPF